MEEWRNSCSDLDSSAQFLSEVLCPRGVWGSHDIVTRTQSHFLASWQGCEGGGWAGGRCCVRGWCYLSG